MDAVVSVCKIQHLQNVVYADRCDCTVRGGNFGGCGNQRELMT